MQPSQDLCIRAMSHPTVWFFLSNRSQPSGSDVCLMLLAQGSGMDQGASDFSSFQPAALQPLGSPLPIFSGQSPSKQHFSPAGLNQNQQQQLPQNLTPEQLMEAERRSMLEGGPTRGQLRLQEEQALQQSVQAGLNAGPATNSPFSAQGQNNAVVGCPCVWVILHPFGRDMLFTCPEGCLDGCIQDSPWIWRNASQTLKGDLHEECCRG